MVGVGLGSLGVNDNGFAVPQGHQVGPYGVGFWLLQVVEHLRRRCCELVQSVVCLTTRWLETALFPATIPQRGGRFKTCGRVGTTQNLAANGVELPRIDDGRPVEERYNAGTLQ